MPQKTIITKVNELGEENGIRLFFPQNRVLYVDHFTNQSPDTPEELAAYMPHTIDDVFDHYKPCVERIELSNENGEISFENFHFNEIGDFDDEQLIAHSETLRNSLYKQDTYFSIIRFLEHDRKLKSLISDHEGRQALKNVLKAMRNELLETKAE